MTRPAHIWVFDSSRRVYREVTPDEKAAGKLWAGGGPIWREHWIKLEITGETSRSWITERGHKVPKKGADPHQFLFSEKQVEQSAWDKDHRHKIVQRIEWRGSNGISLTQLEAIAEILGYEPKMPR